MISAVVSGRVGADAQVRDVGGDQVLQFNLASDTVVKGEKRTTWVRVSLWGKRGVAISQYVIKGSYVVASGSLEAKESQGKTYLEMRASDVELGPKQQRGGDFPDF